MEELEVKKISRHNFVPSCSRKTYLLLGRRREDSQRVYLEQPSWDCGWYYGFGYLEVLQRGGRDINEHYHLDRWQRSDKNLFDWLKEHFKELVFDDKKLWVFCDLVATAYTLKEAYSIYYHGGSNYAENPLRRKLKGQRGMARKVKEDLKAVLLEINKMFGFEGGILENN